MVCSNCGQSRYLMVCSNCAIQGKYQIMKAEMSTRTLEFKSAGVWCQDCITKSGNRKNSLWGSDTFNCPRCGDKMKSFYDLK